MVMLDTRDHPRSLAALASALTKAQAAFPAIERGKTVSVTTRTGGSYTFKYAPLDTILAAVRGPLAENGLALSQLLDGDDLVTLLLHESGESLEARTPLPHSDGDSVQALGSAITYLRRYAIQALLAIAAEEDDDGNSAAGNKVRAVEPDGETLEFLGNLQKSGVAVKGGPDQYQGVWIEEPEGHAIGFRLKLDGDDRDIPQVKLMGAIGQALYTSGFHKDGLLKERVTLKGRLYNVRQKGRTTYYRLIVGEAPSDFIETSEVRLPAAVVAEATVPMGLVEPVSDAEARAILAAELAEASR